MGRRSSERIQFRVSQDELKTLELIRKNGDFPDQSTTVRFCIQFTKTILSILPEAIGEAFIESLDENGDKE